MASQNGNGEINMTWLWIILAFMFGGFFAIMVFSCLIVAGDDKRYEKLNTDEDDKQQHVCQLFYLEEHLWNGDKMRAFL